jgi:hypothetical protein
VAGCCECCLNGFGDGAGRHVNHGVRCASVWRRRDGPAPRNLQVLLDGREQLVFLSQSVVQLVSGVDEGYEFGQRRCELGE